MVLRLAVIMAALLGAGPEPGETSPPPDTSPDRSLVCILANTDPDDRNAPFNDELIFIDASQGDVVSTVGNLNMRRSRSALPAMCASCDGRSIYLCDRSDFVHKYDSNGDLVWKSRVPGAAAIACMGDGSVLAYRSWQVPGVCEPRGYKIELVRIDAATGAKLSCVDVDSSGDLVVDVKHQRVWLVGSRHVTCFDYTLSPLLYLRESNTSHIEVCSDGSVWLARPGRLTRIDVEGNFLVDVPTIDDPCVMSVDLHDDSLWLGSSAGGVLKLNTRGEELYYTCSQVIQAIHVDQRSGDVWYVDHTGDLLQRSRSGEFLGQRPLRSMTRGFWITTASVNTN